MPSTRLSIAVFVSVPLLIVAACSVTANGLDMRDPVREAEATRIAQATQDEAAQRAIERQILEAQASKARTDAQAAEKSLPAAILRNALSFVGVGTGILVVTVGSAFALVAWLNKRATSVYPDSSGQYPIFVYKGLGWRAFHDPNRSLGPAAAYHTPTWLDQALHAAAAIAVTIRTGQPPALLSPKPQGDFPQAGSEDTMERITARHQAVQLMAGATRGAAADQVHEQVSTIAARLVTPSSVLGESGQPALPAVTYLTDPREIEQFKRTYVFEAEGSDLEE